MSADENRQNHLKDRLFSALCNGKDKCVIDLCKEHGPLLEVTLHGSTVLNVACYFKKFDLASKLFNQLVRDLSSNPNELLHKLSNPKNAWGSTILHDASTSNKGIQFVDDLLKKVPDLLEVRNKWKESVLLTAIRSGNGRMFNFLLLKVEEFCITKGYDPNRCLHHFFERYDNMTILHMAIVTRQFDVAYEIADKYRELHNMQDSKHTTALQMLALCPSAFKSGTTLGPLQKLVYYLIVITDEEHKNGGVGILFRKAIEFIFGSSCCRCPMIEKIRHQKKDNENALKLAKTLISSDQSWMATSLPLDSNEALKRSAAGKEIVNEESQSPEASKRSASRTVWTDIDIEELPDIPLFLAARTGCTEIVKEILEKHPRAVDYLNGSQENLLHFALKNRKIEILNIVLENKRSMRGLITAIDKGYNTIQHKMGFTPDPPAEAPVDTELKSPIQELSEELRDLERLEDLCPKYMINYRNESNLTARELFVKEHEELRKDAMGFLKQTAEHCTAVTVLIATVAFAAAYTVPGGPDDKTGLPLLLNRPLFLVFTITDVLSLGFGLTAVVVFLSILTSQFQWRDFTRSLPQRLLLGLTLLFLSVSMMMISFAATIVLTVNSKQQWAKIALYIVAFLPVLIFMLSYVPFYKGLLGSMNYCFMKIRKALPKLEAARHKDKQDALTSVPSAHYV